MKPTAGYGSGGHGSDDATIIDVLAEGLADLTYEDAPERVKAKVRDCLLHAWVVTAGAGETDHPDVVRRVIEEHLVSSGSAGSTVLLGVGRAPASTAAWGNAVLAHARVQEDTHITVHPGVVVIPSALAAAQREGASGTGLLDAVLRGYSTATALSAVLNSRVTPPFRATGAFGPMAAAGAAASILGLDIDGTRRALALAASTSGGTTESFDAGTQEWHFQPGQAAQAGVIAADLARLGVPGSRYAFENSGGFLGAFAGGTRAGDRSAVEDHLTSGLGILEVTFKPYPVCAFNQAPGAAAVELSSRLDGRKIARVEVLMSSAEARYPGVDNAGRITTAEQAIMSVQCAVASALLDGNITFRRLRATNSPPMCALIPLIHVTADESLPDKHAVVSVTLEDGDVLTCPSPDMNVDLRWGPEQVMANAVRMLPETVLTQESLAHLDEAISALEGAESLDRLVRALP
ncbi:MmgE/PrpD family protein [Aeromicrobium sp. CTD01-1L150]|uniref:MmgE/PrpD family protein n=1 Tax=Aeromicrobium sp. CTD01-1L150 TaxID=3341830 RepID=UPI0035BFC1D6